MWYNIDTKERKGNQYGKIQETTPRGTSRALMGVPFYLKVVKKLTMSDRAPIVKKLTLNSG